MKKIITLLLVLTGMVCTASAWDGDMYLRADGHWDDNYSGYKCIRINANEYYIRLEGSVINDGAFYFRFYNSDYTYNDQYAGNKQVVGPTNFYQAADNNWYNQDVEVNSTKVTSTNVDNWQNKSFYVAADPNASYLDIYMKWDNETWNITAIPLYKRTIYWDNSETSTWTTVKAYTYDENVGDHRKIEDLGAWGDVATLSANADGKYSVTFYGTSSVKAIFNDGGSEQSANLSVTNNGIYKGKDSSDPYAIRVAVTSEGYATFSSTKDVNFSTLTSSVLAKKASIDSNGKITYTEVSTVPAGEGVLLESVSGDAVSLDVLVETGSVPANEGNQFVAIEETFKLAQSTESGYTNFILSKVDDTLGFYKVNTEGSWCAGGSAYLKVADANVPSARSFFPLWDEDATGVEAVKLNQEVNGEFFNLAGLRVAQPTKGLYIVNGKKVLY